MKIKFTHYITAICIAFMNLTAQAQSKVTHIDFQKLVSEMPEVIAAQEEIQKLEKDYTNEIESSLKSNDPLYVIDGFPITGAGVSTSSINRLLGDHKVCFISCCFIYP